MTICQMKNDPQQRDFPNRYAWELWKKLTDFSEFLWDAYEYDFLTLAASEPPPKIYPPDDLPF